MRYSCEVFTKQNPEKTQKISINWYLAIDNRSETITNRFPVIDYLYTQDYRRAHCEFTLIFANLIHWLTDWLTDWLSAISRPTCPDRGTRVDIIKMGIENFSKHYLRKCRLSLVEPRLSLVQSVFSDDVFLSSWRCWNKCCGDWN